jgi:hypothetical protein
MSSVHANAGDGVAAPRPGRSPQPYRPSEDLIHRALVGHLAVRARPDIAWWHTPNGGSRHRAEAARMSGLGVKAGVPDFLFVAGGRGYALELKRPGGKLSPAQRDMHDKLRAAGAEVATAYGLDEALAILKDWGLIR